MLFPNIRRNLKASNNLVQWDHLYLLGSMFVRSQTFPGAFRRNFFGSFIGKFLENIEQMIVYKFVGM